MKYVFVFIAFLFVCACDSCSTVNQTDQTETPAEITQPDTLQ